MTTTPMMIKNIAVSKKFAPFALQLANYYYIFHLCKE